MTTSEKELAVDHRDRLYRNYLSEQMSLDVGRIKKSLHVGLPYYKQLVDRHMPQDRSSNILDIGCGYGPLLYELKRAGYSNISGVDVSSEQVRVGRDLGLDCIREGTLLGALNDLPDAGLDAVAAIDVLEHFTKEEILALLDEIRRVLRPSGILLLHLPNGSAIFAGKIFFGDFTHQTAFTPKSVRQIALACGFSSVSCYEDKPIPHGLVSTARAALWWLVRTNFRILNAIETGDWGAGLILSQNLLAVCSR